MQKKAVSFGGAVSTIQSGYSPWTIPNQKVHHKMKLKAFSVSPFTKKPAAFCAEKLPHLGSMVNDCFVLDRNLTLLFLLGGATLVDDVRGLAGGDGEMKYLLGARLALMPNTIRLVTTTEIT